MADASDFEVDPAIAAAMGFSGFGASSNKKRKFNKDDGFVDPDIVTAAHQSSGANSVAVGPRNGSRVQRTTDHQPLPSAQAQFVGSRPEQVAAVPVKTDEPSLDALRHGVTNAAGDMVYFKQSFIEDPWAPLRQGRAS
jgi:hypothetical protein